AIEDVKLLDAGIRGCGQPDRRKAQKGHQTHGSVHALLPRFCGSLLRLLLALARHSIVTNAARTMGRRRQITRGPQYYSTALPNLFDFGRPCARRPASARLPRQSDNSFMVMLCSRPDESFHVRPALASNTATSDNSALRYFCRRTPRPRAISGTWSIGKITILWL